MYGVVGREIDREAGLDGRGDQAPVLDGDRVLAENGLVGEGDSVLDDVGVAEPITLPPLDHVAIHIVEEDLFGFLGGLGLNDNFGVLAGVTGQADLPFRHVFSPRSGMLLTPRAPSTAVEGAVRLNNLRS